MLDVKYEGLGGTGLVTTPLNMAPNLSECNVSHGGIALIAYFILLHMVNHISKIQSGHSVILASSFGQTLNYLLF